MKRWMKRIGGAVLMGVMWAALWMPIGLIIGGIVDPDGSMDEPWIAVGTLPGFLSGLVFCVVVWIAERGRRFNTMSFARAAALGAAAGLVVGLIPMLAGDTPAGSARVWLFVIPAAIALLSAASAAGVLRLARDGNFNFIDVSADNRRRGSVIASHAFALFCAVAPAAGAQAGRADPRTLDSLAGAGVRENRAIGLVAAVMKGNDTVLMKAYGKADLEWDVPMTTDAMFEIGSVSKQFAAAAILQLLDAGKLSLDDPITKWLPFVGASGNKVTLRHLLTHTSGIRGFADEDAWEQYMFMPRYPRDSADKLVKLLEPFKFQPGEAQAYSNSGFWLLGRVVEKASGMKYEDYVQSKIFEPLGMKRSMYCDSYANVTRRAHGYHMPPGMIARAPTVNYGWVFAAGALCSTAGDLVTWLKALHGGKVLSAKSYAEMTSRAKLNDGSLVEYGMGIKVREDMRGNKYISHGGTAPGFRSEAMWFPDAQMAVVVLMNTSPASFSPVDVALKLAGEVVPGPRPETKFYMGDGAEFAGQYTWVVGGNHPPITIVVTPSPNGLSFAPGPGARSQPLPWAGGLKFFAQETTTLTFRRANGDSGPVIELRRDDGGNHSILKKQ